MNEDRQIELSILAERLVIDNYLHRYNRKLIFSLIKFKINYLEIEYFLTRCYREILKFNEKHFISNKNIHIKFEQKRLNNDGELW